MRNTTDDEKHKYYCSSKNCKETPTVVEIQEFVRKGKAFERTRYLCDLHKPKHKTIELKENEITSKVNIIPMELPKRRWFDKLTDLLFP